MRPHPWAWIVAVASLAGMTFAAVSTHDFVAHLDRQVHGVHCSFLPGLVAADASGTSGCHATMMSPYASFWRNRIWGGVPISLPAMAVFAFLLFWCAYLIIDRRHEERRATGFLVAASGLPLLASLVMGAIALFELNAACKLCIGIYAASLGAALGAVGLWRHASALPAVAFAGLRERVVDVQGPTLMLAHGMAPPDADPPFPGTRPRGRGETGAPLSWTALGIAFGVGVVFVALPVIAYAMMAPDFTRYAEGCGQLKAQAGADPVLVPLGGRGTGTDILEVLDPLCPACRAFETRFERWSKDREVRRRALLFPLDNTCNWMVDRAIHPGACAISEAVLCAEGDAPEVLHWAFSEQEAIMQAAAKDAGAASRMAAERFPSLRGCLGKPAVRARLNRGLRWAVTQELPVLTPQVYVDGTRLCDEDTDLGMDYILSHMLRPRGTP